MPAEEVKIDLANATDAELHSIRNEVMRRIAERASGLHPIDLKAEYDRHGSGHSRSSPPSRFPGEERVVLPADVSTRTGH